MEINELIAFVLQKEDFIDWCQKVFVATSSVHLRLLILTC